MFHKSKLGSYGKSLPCDIMGYVPELGDNYTDGAWDACHDWDDDSWQDFVADAVEDTESAHAELSKWQEANK